MLEPTKVQKLFEEEIIKSGVDTKSIKWEKKSQELEEVVGKRGFEINLLSPLHCIFESIDHLLLKEKYGVLVQHLDRLENAFYCLSLFALNLCRDAKRSDYHFIKTYTGFYTCNVDSVMKGTDLPILQSMGYSVSATENCDELYLDHVNENIRDLAYQLYLSQLYCRRSKMVTLAINEHDFSDDIVVKVFMHLDKPEFDMKQVFHYCKIFDRETKKLGVDQSRLHPQSSIFPRISNTSPMHSLIKDDVADDDLYGETNTPELGSFDSHIPAGFPIHMTNQDYSENIVYPPCMSNAQQPFPMPSIYQQQQEEGDLQRQFRNMHSTNSAYSTRREMDK